MSDETEITEPEQVGLEPVESEQAASEQTESEQPDFEIPEEEIAAEPRTIPDVVEFKHPFFSAVDGIYFRIPEGSEDAVMVTPLDTGSVELRLNSIAKELKLADESDDGHMLETVANALHFVQGIKEGDNIPTELKTGAASWEVTDRDRAIAQGRLSMQLVTWMSGDEEVVTDMEQLAMVSEDPTMKAKISEAFGEAAEKLGLGRDNSEQVIDIVESLGEELAYIEALRKQLRRISVVETRIEELGEIYRSERGTLETVTSVSRLCGVAMKGFRDDFEDVDAQTGEIMAVLKNIGAQVKYIRTNRDALYKRFWAWKEIVEKWETQPAKRSRPSEDLLQETYRFLAQRFLPQNEWELFTKAQERAANADTESMW